MSSAAGPSIATSGLVLDFDAANLKSFGPPTVEVLVVAGGGGGGGSFGGGGGGGGLIYNSAFLVTAGTAVTVTVGAAGAGSIATTVGGNGGNSVFSTLTAIGGGGGGSDSSDAGVAGGSGGGGSIDGAGGAATSGQGYAGGLGDRVYYQGGGGGGAGAVGTPSGVANVGAAGGRGLLYDISGALVYYAGGGGGGAGTQVHGVAGAAGLGGAGAGGTSGNSNAGMTAGTANTGGGGGGGGQGYGGAAGGSGVVIIRYPGLQKATGGTITSVSGYTVHTFTTVGSSTFTPGTNWADISGNTNLGTLTNGPTYSAANGGSLVFDGSNDLIVLPTFTNKPTTSMTVSAWIYPTRTPSTSTIRGGAISSSNSMYLGIIDSIDGGVGHALHFASQTSVNRITSWHGSIPANQWSYIVGTYDGSTMRAYLNGTEVYSAAQTGTIPDATYYVGTYAGYTDAVHNFLGNISTAQIYNRALSVAEIAQNFNAQIGRYRFGLGTHQSVPAISAAAIKADNNSVQSGVYWLYSTGINSGAPFRCYCDFTMDGGIGYAIYFQQYFDSTDDGGTAGYEYGPTFTSMQSTAITGTTGYSNEFNVYPNLMPIQYNNGAGASRMIVYNKTNTGASASGVQGATNYKWTRISGITATNMRDIWTSFAATAQYTVAFVSAGNSGRTSGSGTGYIQGSHGSSGGVYQWVANTSSNVNDYLIFEYKPNATVADPNHYWMVDTGVSGSIYFRANSEYGASGIFQTRYGGIAIY